MNKKLVLVIALSLVLAAGAFSSANAECGLCGFHLPSLCGLNLNPCGWHLPSLCGFHCGNNTAAKDVDKPIAHTIDQSKAVNPAE